MSRSKRAPVWTQGYGSKVRKYSKRLAARSVRVADEVADGAGYKRIFNSWDIIDFKFFDKSSLKVRRK